MGGGRSYKSDESTLGRAKKSGKKATTIRAGVFELLLAYQSRTYQQKGVAAFRAQIDEYARSQTTTKGGAAAVFSCGTIIKRTLQSIPSPRIHFIRIPNAFSTEVQSHSM